MPFSAVAKVKLVQARMTAFGERRRAVRWEKQHPSGVSGQRQADVRTLNDSRMSVMSRSIVVSFSRRSK